MSLLRRKPQRRYEGDQKWTAMLHCCP